MTRFSLLVGVGCLTAALASSLHDLDDEVIEDLLKIHESRRLAEELPQGHIRSNEAGYKWLKNAGHDADWAERGDHYAGPNTGWQHALGIFDKPPGPKKKMLVLLSRGLTDPLQTHLGIVMGWAAKSEGNDVDFLVMGEGATIIDDTWLQKLQGFGLPPIRMFMDTKEMAADMIAAKPALAAFPFGLLEDCLWMVWHFCADSRNIPIETMGTHWKFRKGVLVGPPDFKGIFSTYDDILTF